MKFTFTKSAQLSDNPFTILTPGMTVLAHAPTEEAAQQIVDALNGKQAISPIRLTNDGRNPQEYFADAELSGDAGVYDEIGIRIGKNGVENSVAWLCVGLHGKTNEPVIRLTSDSDPDVIVADFYPCRPLVDAYVVHQINR